MCDTRKRQDRLKGSITTNGQVRINAPELFGGDKGEGGLDGTLDVLFGDEDQGVLPRLAAMLGGLVPAFRESAPASIPAWLHRLTRIRRSGRFCVEAGTVCGTATPGIPKSSSSG